MSRKGVFKMLSFGVNDNVIGDVIVGGRQTWEYKFNYGEFV